MSGTPPCEPDAGGYLAASRGAGAGVHQPGMQAAATLAAEVANLPTPGKGDGLWQFPLSSRVAQGRSPGGSGVSLLLLLVINKY